MIYLIGSPIPAGATGHVWGRQLLRELYGRHRSGPMPEIVLGPMGKPAFAGGEAHFSITHTKKTAFCALAAFPVGLDAEEQDRRVSPALARRVLTPEEYRAWEGAEDPNALFLRFWVLKEAWGKWSGEGLGGDPRRLALNPADMAPRDHGVCSCLMSYLGCHVGICTAGRIFPKVILEKDR